MNESELNELNAKLNPELQQLFDRYGRCEECNQIMTDFNWCHTCNVERFRKNFNNWTSGNKDIDKFIQETQLSAKQHFNILEWISYESFRDIKYIAKGGFGKVYRAKWKDGYIFMWDNKIQNWGRLQPNMFVALKSLNNSKNVTSAFISEITFHHKSINAYFTSYIVRFYGITQDPKTENYMMVLQYAERGSLRNYLDQNYSNLNWENMIQILLDIACGLDQIHQNELIHCDLHIGNILCFPHRIFITDMGLCKPVNYNMMENTKNDIYGISLYIAPEILRRQIYTKAADIYSFDANQSNRPTSKEIKEILKEWREEINSRTHNSTELIKQIKEAEEMNNNLSAINTPSKFHENISNMEYSGTIVNNFVMLKLIVKE
ncbi:kinase-like domain-containing protein [Rhizophagus irregularis DAOM 181602=DAOM 197198]|nr:kinase-like domain-containing protein [Rhizophagus irregularis DAOM 181602=DAOM 197198]